jgi:hypothetical protein
MTLRDEIANLYAKRRYGRCWQDVEAKIESENFADSILALINEERCEWTYADHNECWNSACGMEMFEPEPSKFQFDRYPYCPCCGRKIKVKDS